MLRLPKLWSTIFACDVPDTTPGMDRAADATLLPLFFLPLTFLLHLNRCLSHPILAPVATVRPPSTTKACPIT
jgi:hypothetical protein